MAYIKSSEGIKIQDLKFKIEFSINCSFKVSQNPIFDLKNRNMNGLVRFLLNGLAVLLTGYLLQKGVYIEHYGYALLVVVVLAITNVLVKPILILFTIPITIVTLGLFLLVINALIILLVDYLVPGFRVEGFWWALGFSLILSIFNSIVTDLTKEKKK
jgi:putative membrane protein